MDAARLGLRQFERRQVPGGVDHQVGELRAGAVEEFLQVADAVAIGVFDIVAVFEGIERVGDFPLVRHAVVVVVVVADVAAADRVGAVAAGRAVTVEVGVARIGLRQAEVVVIGDQVGIIVWRTDRDVEAHGQGFGNILVAVLDQDRDRPDDIAENTGDRRLP